MYRETNGRSLIKTISWRLLATITTAALVYLFTKDVDVALKIGGIEILLKLLIYYLHERFWNKITFGKREIQPSVIWFTGLSGAGKSTISEEVFSRLKAKGLKVEHLDGDLVREIFPKTGFSKEDRDRHVKRVGFLASILEKNGVIVLASFISPYKESRNFVRNLCKNFKEVHVATPLEECEKRDVKGLYEKARKGEITQFTGIDDPYEEPENPEIKVNTTGQSVEESVQYVLRKLGY